MIIIHPIWFSISCMKSIKKISDIVIRPYPYFLLINCKQQGVYRRISSGKVYPVHVLSTRVISSKVEFRTAEEYKKVPPVKMGSESNVFRLSNYDCIGFDLDNTLCNYKLSPMMKMEYNILAKYLVEVKGYDAEFLLQPIERDLDFLRRGLVLDIEGGNILQLGSDGYIQKATHGTRFLGDSEIEKYYGADRKWDVTTEFSQNLLEGWSGPLATRIKTLLDYFDAPAGLIYARLVDTVDKKNGKELKEYSIWSDILEGIVNMYQREKFCRNEGGYFPALKANPDLYINKCTENVKNWLRKIKDSKLVFLITGSHVDFASLTAGHILGDDWRDLFDIVVCYSRKPGFFTGGRPFLKLDGIVETDTVPLSQLEFGNLYSQGNWQDLYNLLTRKTGLTHPKCVYFGDHLIQDVYTPSKYTRCDTVAVVEELHAEGMVNLDIGHVDAPMLVSRSWGSFFCDKKNGEVSDTLWGDIIKNHSKICIPSLDVLAKHPLDYEIRSFHVKDSLWQSGYFPSDPASLHKQ